MDPDQSSRTIAGPSNSGRSSPVAYRSPAAAHQYDHTEVLPSDIDVAPPPSPPAYQHPSAAQRYNYPKVPPRPLHLQHLQPHDPSPAVEEGSQGRQRTSSASTVNNNADASLASAGAGEEGGKGQRKPKPKRHLDDEQGRVAATSRKGHSVLPTARIMKIIKADEDIRIANKEAVFLISLATEHFVRKLTLASYTEARLERRVAVKYNDVAKAVASNDYFFYLQDVVPPTITASEARRKVAEQATADEAADKDGLDVVENGHAGTTDVEEGVGGLGLGVASGSGWQGGAAAGEDRMDVDARASAASASDEDELP